MKHFTRSTLDNRVFARHGLQSPADPPEAGRAEKTTVFERVMNTGVTNDGGMVHKPMPVYHLPAAKSDALYAYLKTLK